jgi:hypothetical protein
MEERAQQHHQKRQDTEDMGGVLGDEEKCGNGEERE